MNIETGEIFAAEVMTEAMMRDERKKVIPEEHEAEARAILGGGTYGRINTTKPSPLSSWQQQQLHHLNQKNKRRAATKAAQASRKKNRGK